MKYLLDVNALLAWRHARSPHHEAFHSWALREGMENLGTCAHSELGFIRVSMQAFGYTLAESQAALEAIKRQAGWYLETAPSPKLASWAMTAPKTSDAYLNQLAAVAGVKLATFDAGIPGAIRISDKL